MMLTIRRHIRSLPRRLFFRCLPLALIASGPFAVHAITVLPAGIGADDPAGAGLAAWVDDLSPIAAAD